MVGFLIFLERFGVLGIALDIFWAAVFLVAGIYFLYRFTLNKAKEWWAVILGLALVGMGVSVILPERWSGLSFLGLLGISFFVVYFSNHQHWLAIIPGGVLITLSVIALLADMYGARETGGFFLPRAWFDFLAGGNSSFHAMGIHTGCNLTFDGRCTGLYTHGGRAQLHLAGGVDPDGAFAYLSIYPAQINIR